MPDFSLPQVPRPSPLESTVTLQDVAMPVVTPTVEFYNASANEGLALTAAEVRDALLGTGREIDFYNKGKTPAQSGIDVSYTQAKRYNDPTLGYSPFRDNEDLYARNQSSLESMGSGLGRLGLTAFTKLGTGLGYLGSLVTSAFDPAGRSRYGDGLSAWLANAGDNAFSHQFEKWEEGVKNDLLPIYQEASDLNKGFFSRALTDLNFWTEDVSDGAAFMISALAPGMAIAKLNVGAKTLTGLAKMFGYSDEALDAARAAELFGGSLKTGATAASTELKYVPKVLGIISNARAARSVDVGIQTLVSTASEAMFEANDTKERIYQNLINQGVSVQDAARQAAQGAKDTFAMNLAALSFSNLWEANLIFKRLPSTSNQALGQATREGLTGATTIARGSQRGDFIKDILKGIGVEGFYEENVQLAMQRINEQQPSADFATKISALAEQTATQTINAILGKDTEAATNIGIGALIGGGAAAISSGFDVARNAKYRQSVEANLNSYAAAFQSLKDVYNSDGTLNEEAIKKIAASQGNILELMDLVDLAEQNQAPVLKDIYEGELFAQFAYAHFQNGLADLLTEKLNNLDKLTDQDLQALGYDSQSKEGAGVKLQELRNQAVQLQGLYDNIQRNVIGTDEKITNFRKQELYRLGSRSITLTKQAERVKSEISALNARTGVNVTVEELNNMIAKLQAAQRFYEALQNEQALVPGSVEDETMSNRKKQVDDVQKDIDDFKENNQRSLASAKQDQDGFFNTDSVTEDVLTRAEKRRAMVKLAEIELSKNSVDERFQRIANPATGQKFTKDYYDKIVATARPKPTVTKLPLGNVSTQEYQDYEQGRLRRQRIQSALGDIERDARSELLTANLPDADTDQILSLVNQALDENIEFSQDDKDLIVSRLSDALDNQIGDLQQRIDNLQSREQVLGGILPEDMTMEEEDEYSYIATEFPKLQDQINELNGLKNSAASLRTFTPTPERSEALLRREIAEEYFVEPEKIITDIQQSSEGYDSPSDLANIDTQIKQLENLRSVFVERRDLDSSPEFTGFVDRIASYIEQLKGARVEVEKRVADRSLADQRALSNHVYLTGQSVGMDLNEGTFTALYPITSSVLDATFPKETATVVDVLNAAKAEKDTKKTLYSLEAYQSLLKKAVKENFDIASKFNTELAGYQEKTLNSFATQPGLAIVRAGNITNQQVADVYSKNPANVFRYIISTISNQVYDLDRKDSPIYKFLQDLNITEFLRNAKDDIRDGQDLSQADLVDLIQAHIAFQASKDIQDFIKSELSMIEEVENELNVINKSITANSKPEPDSNVVVQTPSNEQLIALRQLTNFVFSQTGRAGFSNWAYLKGAAGTGKSQIISKWLLKLAKISTKDVFAIGHNLSSSANINGILGKGDIAPLAKQLIDALATNQPMKLILIDEIGGFTSNDLLEIEDALDKYNKANNTAVKIIALGDPNQITVKSGGSLSTRPAIETVQYTKSQPFEGRLNNITVISPLTIRYRSDVNQVNNFSDKFINQKQDLSSQEMIVTSNNPSLENGRLVSEPLFGVVGTKNFSGALQRILPVLSGKNDERTRAIITTPSKVATYAKLLTDNNIDLTKVEVLSYLDAQGRTIDEVYIDIPNTQSEFSNNIIYNKAMYVAASRATSFVLVGNYNTTNETDNSISADVTSKQQDIRNSSEAFKNDRTQELEILKSVVTIPDSSKVTTNSAPEETKKSVDQEDVQEAEETVDDNPAPPFDVAEESTLTEERSAVITRETEIKVDFDKVGVHTLKFPTSEAATNIVLFEGQATPSYLSPRSLSSLERAEQAPEIRNRATSVGDKAIYTPAATKEGIFFVLVTSLKDSKGNPVTNRYRQLGVIGDQELEDMKDNPDLVEFYEKLSNYRNNPDAKAIQIDLDKNELNIPNIITVLEGEIADIDYLNFEYGATPSTFSLNSVVNTVVSGLFPNDSNRAKKVSDIQKDAKIVIYRAADPKPQPWMLPGVPYLILSNVTGGTSRAAKSLYVELTPRTLNKNINEEYTKPIEQFVDAITALQTMFSEQLGETNLVYGNAVFENAIIKIARRNTTGDFEVAGRTIDVTDRMLALARQADALHLKPSSASLKVGSKVKYINTNLSFTTVGTHVKDAKDGSYKKGEKYTYKSPGEVVEVQSSRDPNTDEEIINAVRVRYYNLNDARETQENVTDFIPVTELSNSKTENGPAQVALNSIWRANEAAIRKSGASFIEGEEPIATEGGQTRTRRIFQYPSILRSESSNSGFNPNALDTLRSVVNFDDAGTHIGNDTIPSLRVPVPRSTNRVNFTDSGLNSINDAKVTKKYLQSTLKSVSPTRVSVTLGKSTQPRTQTSPAPKTAIPKVNIPRGRRLATSAYSAEQLGRDFSREQTKKFIKSRLPDLTDAQIDERVIFVDEAQMMRITGGRPAWGYFVDNLIYLQSDTNDTVKENTVRHEVAHYIFNNYLNDNQRRRFINDLKQDRPFMNFMTQDEVLEYVDEVIAEGYQNYQSVGSLSKFIKGVIRKIANFLGFATPFIRNLNDYFDAIDQGIFSKPSNEQLLVGRPLLSIKEDFGGNVQNYLRAQEMFGSLMNYFMNPQESIQEDEDGNLTNVPLSRAEGVTQVMRYFQSRVDEFNSIEDKSQINSDDMQDYEVALLLTERDKRGKNRIFEELVKDFYPSFRFVKIPGTNEYQPIETNKAFDYDYSSDSDYAENLGEEIQPNEEGDEIVAGNEGWFDDQDTVNPLKKASQAVKDFMSAMVVEIGDNFERIKPGYVFYKLLQNLSGIDVNDLPEGNEVREEIRQIRANFQYNGMVDVEDPSNRDWVIYNRLVSLLNTTDTSVDSEGNRLPSDSYFVWRGDNQKGYYEFFHNGKVISSLTKGNRKPTEEFFKDIKGITRLPYETIKALYNKKEAAEAVNSIYMVINSMRSKSPMFGEYEWKWTKGKQILKRVYGAFKDESSLSAAKAFATNIIATRYQALDKFKDKLEGRRAEKNKVALAKSIMVEMGLIRHPSAVYMREDTALYLLNSFDAIRKSSQDIGKQIGVNPDDNTPLIYDAQEFTNDLKKYISQIAKVINSRKTEVGRSSSYIGGDRKPRWFFMNSTQAFDTFRKIIEGRPLRGFMTNNRSIFYWNTFNPEGVGKLSSIYSLRDHDSIGEVDSQRDPVLYRRELTKDFIERNFMYGFVNFLADTTTQGLTYLQQFYTISNKPNMLAAQIDLLSHTQVSEAIDRAIEQESQRIPKGIANYDTNVNDRITYLVGLEKALTPEEYANKKTKNAAIKSVYNELSNRSLEAFQSYMAMSPVLDKNMNAVYNRLLDDYLDPAIIKKYPEFEDAANFGANFRYGSFTEEEFTRAVYPVFDLFYKNYFINSLFLNQIAAGDQAQYKDEYDEIKRMSMAFAIGYRGRVNDETGLRRTYNVAVAKDFKDTIGENTLIGRNFKKLLGASYELTDAQGFITPERGDNIRRGFSREANLGATLKPVYFGIDNEGVARGVKYSTVELTNELVSVFPDLADLRYSMTFGRSEYANDLETINLYRAYIKNQISQDDKTEYERRVNSVIDEGYHVDELVFESAFKVGKPVNITDWKADALIKPESVVQLTNDNYRHQLNPRHDSDTKTSNPSQLTYQINTNGKNFSRLRKVLNLNALMHNYGMKDVMNKLFPNGDIDNRARRTVRQTIAEPLGKVPGNERYAEFIQDPEISLNLPNITNKLQQSFLAYISKRTIEIKHKGSKLVLQSSFGTTARDILNASQQTEPRLVFVDGKGLTSYEEGFDESSISSYYMEVYLPNIYKNQNLNIGSEAWLNDPVYNSLMGFRIPSTELHSAVPLKVKGFYPSEYGDNIIIAPKELVVLHGSDFDVDSLYTINKFVAHADLVSPEGVQVTSEGVAVGYKYNPSRGTTKMEMKGSENLVDWIVKEMDRIEPFLQDDTKGPIYREYQSKLATILPQAASNEILDTFLETISAQENIQDMMSPISMAVFNDVEDQNSVFYTFADLLSEKETGKGLPAKPGRHEYPSDLEYNKALRNWRNNAMKYIRPRRNLNLVDDEVQMHQDNFRASLGTGIAANAFKIISYIFMGATNMVSNRNLTEEQQPLPKLKDSYHMEIDGHNYDGFSRYVIRNGKLLDSGDQRTTTFQIIDSIINAAIDHVKEQILNVVNISNKTINAYISMIAMGIEPKIVSLFVAQPALREISDRAADRNALNNVTSELRQALLKNFASDDYIQRYNEVEQDQELRPVEKNRRLRDIANSYFNNIAKVEDFENIKLTTVGLEDSFKLDYDPMRMTKVQLLTQMKVLSEFRKADYLGDYLSKGSRALNSIRQVPSDFASMENILLLYSKFFDVNSAIANADPDSLERMDVGIPERFPFSNVDLSTVLNISSSLNVMDKVMDATGKIFLREGKTLVDFSDKINSFMLDAGIQDVGTQQKSDEEVEYVKQYDRGFLDWNAAKSLQRIRQAFVEYLMTGISFELSSGELVDMSVSSELPLEYEYETKETGPDDEMYTVKKTATATGVTAWTRRFVDTGIETVRNGKKVRLKPISRLIEQYGFNSETSNDFLANLSIRRTRKTKSPYLTFAFGSSLDSAEKIDFENEFNKLKNLSIYETVDGKDIEPEILGDEEFNELQYNLLKYDILANGLAFGSYSYSQVMSIPIFRQVSKKLDEFMFGLLDERNPKFDIDKIQDHFALQLALMNIDKVRAIGSLIELDKDKQPVFGYDEEYDTYYDLIVKDYESKNLKGGDLPTFAKRGSTLYVRVAPNRESVKHAYYQRVERYNETKSFSFSEEILYGDNGYRLEDYFPNNKLAVSALAISPTRDNMFVVELDPRFEPKASLALPDSRIIVHSPSDYSRMNAEEFEVFTTSNKVKNGKQVVILELKRLSSADIANDFINFSIREVDKANKEIRETQNKLGKDCKK